MVNMVDKKEQIPIDEVLMAFILNIRLILSYVLGWQDERNTVNRWAWHVLARAVQFALFAAGLALPVYCVLLGILPYQSLWLVIFLALWAWQVAGLVWNVGIAPVWKAWKDEAGQRKLQEKARKQAERNQRLEKPG